MVRRLLLIAAITFASAPALAQEHDRARVQGTVVDSAAGGPLAGSHVFIAGSLTGTTTDRSGVFDLSRVRPGAVRIVVSMVGYRPATIDTLLGAGDAIELDVRLVEDVVLLGALEIRGERPARWERRLRRFQQLFIGESANAASTELMNPEVLDFEARLGLLRARAVRPLEILNHALGYRLTYVLKEFERSGSTVRYDGDPFFEELEPGDADQEHQWSVARCEAYFGSFRHFMLSLLDGSTRDVGFITHSRMRLEDRPHNPPFHIPPGRLIREADDPSLRKLRFGGFLEVIYGWKLESDEFLRWHYRAAHARPRPRTSLLRLKGREVLIDQHGEPLDPYAITLYGYFAFERIGDLLPKEYRPPDGVTEPRNCADALTAGR